MAHVVRLGGQRTHDLRPVGQQTERLWGDQPCGDDHADQREAVAADQGVCQGSEPDQRGQVGWGDMRGRDGPAEGGTPEVLVADRTLHADDVRGHRRSQVRGCQGGERDGATGVHPAG